MKRLSILLALTASPAMADSGAAYMVLTSDEAITLVSVSVPAEVAGRAEIHEVVPVGDSMSNDDDSMSDDEMDHEITRRAIADPKPLYYAEPFFDAQVAAYLAEHQLDAAEEIEPDHFVRWVFPKLLTHRKPLYESIATRYGYTVSAADTESVRDELDFVELVASAIGA